MIAKVYYQSHSDYSSCFYVAIMSAVIQLCQLPDESNSNVNRLQELFQIFVDEIYTLSESDLLIGTFEWNYFNGLARDLLIDFQEHVDSTWEKGDMKDEALYKAVSNTVEKLKALRGEGRTEVVEMS